MQYITSALTEAIAERRELTILHRQRGRILIRPHKLEGGLLIADVIKVDRLGDSPEQAAHLRLKDITLPRV